ncbi:putative 3-ketosphinganine reductase [Patellaria atrata CBS 101060]|uniref:3-dehydrosphinganine reductase n=1 Tax=Patellaria atrata CBS 101060 TaxID=1346257 RepID=A0A9P4VQR3_9PEZI|nr:putative 3-ketosphinganine reductase [Patellaria atrata CBS 101060]
MALGFFWASVLFGIFLIILFSDIMGLFSRKNEFPVDGRTVLLTGASQGMGRSLARLLAERGANVVLVARNVEKLEEALKHAKSGAIRSSQRFHYISADVTSAEQNTRLVEETTEWNNGQPPDIVWANAGSSTPKLFIDASIDTLRSQMDINYWAATYLAHAIFKVWLTPAGDKSSTSPTSQLPRHLVMTSSSLAFVSVAGYSPYSPAKAAMRSLSDSLRSELNYYNGARRSNDPSSAPPVDVKIHTVFPGTITSPGYEQENLTKHKISRILEEGDPVQSADEVALAALKELEKGHYLIATQMLSAAMRASALQGSPRNNWFIDTIFSCACSFAWLFISPDMEGKVYKYGKQNGVKPS